MFDKLLEKIKIADEVEANLNILLEKKTWEEISLVLYKILDDIDTADNMCKENTEAFRDMVMKLQAKKNQYLASYDGQTISRVDEKRRLHAGYGYCPSCGLNTEECKKAFKQGGRCCKDCRDYLAGHISLRDYEEHDPSKKVTKDEDKEEDDKGYKELFRRLAKGSRKVTCPDCGEIFHVSKVELPKIVTCPECGWEKRIDEEKKPLTPKQEETLKKLEPGKWYSAYNLQVGLNTLRALSSKGYLKSKSGLGSMAFPATSIMFKLAENLTDFAKNELELAGLFDKDSDYDGMLGEAVIELIQKFAEQGHSGCSAAMVRELFAKLSNFKPLSELTDNSDEWMEVTEDDQRTGKSLHQSRRSPSCFSGDGGKTYHDIDEDWFYHEDEDGTRWSGGLSEEEWDNRPMHTSKHIEKKSDV